MALLLQQQQQHDKHDISVHHSVVETSHHWEFPVNEPVHAVQFCNIQGCSSMFAYATETRVIVLNHTTSTTSIGGYGDSEQQQRSFLDFETFVEFPCLRGRSISWSPETKMAPSAYLKLAVVGSKFDVHIFESGLSSSEKPVIRLLRGHTDYVNAVSFSPSSLYEEMGVDGMLATVSDDCTARIWSSVNSCNYDNISPIVLQLTSPGVSVCWHTERPRSLLVAERDGALRLYDVATVTPMLCLMPPSVLPLMSADWALEQPWRIGAVSGGHCYLWDLRYPGRTPVSVPVHTDSGQAFRFSPTNENLVVVTSSGIRNVVQLLHTGHMHKDILPTGRRKRQLAGITWHSSLPYLACGGETGLHFWLVES